MTFTYFTSQVKSLNAYEWNFNQYQSNWSQPGPLPLERPNISALYPISVLYFQYCYFSVTWWTPNCKKWTTMHFMAKRMYTHTCKFSSYHSERPKSAGSKNYTLSPQVTSLVTNIAEWLKGRKWAPGSALRMRLTILCRQSYTPKTNAPKTIIEQIDLFSLLLQLFFHFRPCDFRHGTFFSHLLPPEHMTLIWKRNRQILLWISHALFWENKT